MRAIIVGPERRVCRLQPGEVKRFPPDGAPVGFYVACPECGYRNFLLARGQHVTEGAAFTLSPGLWCDGPRCEVHLHIQGGELVVTR
jgi:hypothetical protein